MMWLNLKASAFISLLKNVQEPFGALPFVLYPLESTLNTSSSSQLGGYGKNRHPAHSSQNQTSGLPPLTHMQEQLNPT